MAASLPLKTRDVEEWLDSELAHLTAGDELVSPFWPVHLYGPGLNHLRGRNYLWAQAWGGYPLAELRQLMVTAYEPPRWEETSRAAQLPGRRPFLDFPQRVMQIELNENAPEEQRLFGFIRQGEIDPERFGELRVYDEFCELAAHTEVLERVVDGLERRGLPVEVNRGYSRSLKPDEMRTESCGGNRLDAVVSQFFRVSRSEAQTAIEQEFVAVNWALTGDTSESVERDTLISFRHKGRIRIGEMWENERSGRLMITAEVFPH